MLHGVWKFWHAMMWASVGVKGVRGSLTQHLLLVLQPLHCLWLSNIICLKISLSLLPLQLSIIFPFFSPIRFKFSEKFSSAKCQSITGIGTGKKNYYNWGFWNDKEQKLWKKPPFWYCRSIFEKLRISKYQKLNSTQIWNNANLHHSGRWTLEMITRAGLPTTHRNFSKKSKQLFWSTDNSMRCFQYNFQWWFVTFYFVSLD